MSDLQFGDETIELTAGESVLDGLLRHGIPLPYGCKAGACQACLLQAEPETIPPTAQTGLKPTQKQLGYFLSCQCVPEQAMQVYAPLDKLSTQEVKVLEKDQVGANTLRLRFEKPFDYRPGQYLNIWHHPTPTENPIIRSYSIASVPEQEDFIELHIKVYEHGQFSQWAATSLQPGDTLRVQGPIGDCIYTPDNPLQPLLLAGVGTGLAPLYGIARDALQQGHQGDINIVIGNATPDGVYLWRELVDLNEKCPQIKVSLLSLLGDDQKRGVIEADIYQYIKTDFPSTKEMRAYLCGSASFVQKMKKQIFLSGASMGQIHADAFLPAANSR